MALNKTIVVDRIEVLQRGVIQVRTATVVDEDGTELSRTFHRHILNPGAATSGEAQRVQDIATATWTAQVVADWDAYIAAQEA